MMVPSCPSCPLFSFPPLLLSRLCLVSVLPARLPARCRLLRLVLDCSRIRPLLLRLFAVLGIFSVLVLAPFLARVRPSGLFLLVVCCMSSL